MISQTKKKIHCHKKNVKIFIFFIVTVKEQSIQDYLTNSSGILRQINVKT